MEVPVLLFIRILIQQIDSAKYISYSTSLKEILKNSSYFDMKHESVHLKN